MLERMRNRWRAWFPATVRVDPDKVYVPWPPCRTRECWNLPNADDGLCASCGELAALEQRHRTLREDVLAARMILNRARDGGGPTNAR